MKHILIAVAVCLSVAAPTARGDTNFYVRGDGLGSDTNTGVGWATAFATIQKAVSVTPGWTSTVINVQGSWGGQSYDVTYREDWKAFVIDFEGGWSNVDVSPVQSGYSLVKDLDGGSNETGIELYTKNHGCTQTITVARFQFQSVSNGLTIRTGASDDSADIILTVRDCDISAQADGVRVDYPKNGYSQANEGGYAQFHLTNVTIRAGLAGSGHGVYSAGIYMGSTIGATGTCVSTITSAGGAGVYVEGTSGETSYPLSIRDTVIYDCAHDGIYGTNRYSPPRWTLEHCTIVNCGSNGVRSVTTAAGCWLRISNSICANNAGHGVNLGDAGASNFILYEGYNCFYNDDALTNGAVQALAGNTRAADPVFLARREKPAPYYHLGYTASPCYQSGSDGRNRGAYQNIPGSRGTLIFLK